MPLRPPQLRVLPAPVLSVRDAQAIAGRLGQTSKMPGPSFGLSAKWCKTGSELRQVPGSVCFGCYAMNDFYASWTPVAKGHSKRLDGLEHPRWVDAMVVLIEHAVDPADPYFRWHDAGDLQSADHLRRIMGVCRRTPGVKHWLPTREYAMVAEVLADRVPPPANLCIRLSAHMIDTEAVVPRELAALPTSTVHTAAGHPVITPRERKGAVECQAVAKRDNICGDCRACWDPRVVNVSYPQH